MRGARSGLVCVSEFDVVYAYNPRFHGYVKAEISIPVFNFLIRLEAAEFLNAGYAEFINVVAHCGELHDAGGCRVLVVVVAVEVEVVAVILSVG